MFLNKLGKRMLESTVISLLSKPKVFTFCLCHTFNLSLHVAFCQVQGSLCNSLFDLVESEDLARGWSCERVYESGKVGREELS